MSSYATGSASRAARAEAELPTASEADLRMVRTVFQMVTRQFYSDQHVILIDILSRHLVMPADILACSLGVHLRDLLQIANSLVRDRMVGIHRRSESRETAGTTSVFTRNVVRNYFYLDRKAFLDVTKWRMMKMRSQIDNVLRNELDNKGYMCPRCGKSYSTLDVAALLDPVTMMTFICEVPGCGSELVDNEDSEDVKRSKDRLKRFNEQCGPILDRLRKIDKVMLPSFNVASEVARTGDSDAWKLRARQRIDPNATLQDVQEAQGGARPAASVSIDMVPDDPLMEAAQREKREREAERQRQENALPSWWETTQDPNARRSATGPNAKTAAGADAAGAPSQMSNGASSTNALQDDYYARYASMAQDGDDDDEAGLEFEDVVDSATPSGPSAAQTPTPAGGSGKRSREDSLVVDSANKRARPVAADDDDDDDEELEFEDVA